MWKTSDEERRSRCRRSPSPPPRPAAVLSRAVRRRSRDTVRPRLAGAVHEHEATAAGAGKRALGNPGHERRCDARVDGVPALCQHPGSRLGSQRCPAAIAPLMRRSVSPPDGGHRRATGFAYIVRDWREPGHRRRSAARPLRTQARPGGRAFGRGRRPRRRAARLARSARQSTSQPTPTSGRCSSSTASPSGTTSGTRAATASSPTASSTTRSRRCSGSGCSPSRPSRRRRSRSPSCSGASGARRALVEPHVRRRLGRDRALRRLPVRARRGARAARAAGAPGGRALAASRCSRCSRWPRARSRSCCSRSLLAGDRDRALARRRALLAPARHDRRRRRGRGAALRVRSPTGGASRSRGRSSPRPRLLRDRHRDDLARRAGASYCAGSSSSTSTACVVLLPRPVGDRREHRAAALRRDPDRGAGALAAPLAAAARSPRGARSRGLVERVAARGQLHQGRQRPRRRARRTGRRRSRSCTPTCHPSYRVEAVDTAGHWPAVYLPTAGIPLARGWFRQDDFPQNALLYGELGPRTYLAWLRGLGVRYVVLTNAPPDYSARAEAALFRSGRSGFGPSSAPRTSPCSTCRIRGRS